VVDYNSPVAMPLSITRAHGDAPAATSQLRSAATWMLAVLGALSMFDFGLPDSRPSRPFGMLVGIVCLGVHGVEGRQRRLTSAHFLAFVVVIVLCISTTWATTADATTAAFSAIQLLALFLLAFEFLDSRAAWNRVAAGLALGGSALTLMVLRQFLTGATVNGGRYTGFSKGDPNDVAWGIAIGATLVAHFAFETRSVWVRWGAGALAALSVPATIITGSRSGVIVLMLGLFLVPWRLTGAGPRARARFELLFVIGLVGVSAMIPSDADFRGVDRVLAVRGGEGEGSVSLRAELLAESFRVIGDAPLKGVGVGGGEAVMKERLGEDFSVHNSFASVAMQAGLIAGGAWLLLWFLIARTAWRAEGSLRPVLVAMTVLTIAELMFRHAEYQKPLWLIAALVLATADFGPDRALRPMARPVGQSLALANSGGAGR
jgi:hypothetical protein